MSDDRLEEFAKELGQRVEEGITSDSPFSARTSLRSSFWRTWRRQVTWRERLRFTKKAGLASPYIE